jgi:hypothetical protein
VSPIQRVSLARCSTDLSLSGTAVFLAGFVVLPVADLLHPRRVAPIALLLDRDMCHRRGWRGSMPMLHSGRDKDDVTLVKLLDGTSPTLDPAGPRCHDQHLSNRMAVPSRACAGLEGDQAAGSMRRCLSSEQWLNANSASKTVGRPTLRSL